MNPAVLAPSVLDLQARYESLRAAVLGEEIAPLALSGLNVFLLQGMWSWVRASAQRPSLEPNRSSAFQRADLCPDRRAIVRLLAAMAIAAPDRRTA